MVELAGRKYGILGLQTIRQDSAFQQRSRLYRLLEVTEELRGHFAETLTAEMDDSSGKYKRLELGREFLEKYEASLSARLQESQTPGDLGDYGQKIIPDVVSGAPLVENV